MANLGQLDGIHARLDTLLGQQGAYLDDLYFCPHHPDRGYPEELPEYKVDCQCRKPRPGMLLDAAERYNIDLSRSYMLGDSTADMASGKAAGCTSIGIRTGEGLKDGKYQVVPDKVCDNILEAVAAIVGDI